MAGISAAGSVGASLSQAQFRVAYQTRMLKEQQVVVQDIASAALRLIQSITAVEPTPRHDLDVKA